jgi:hypothetical protein
VPSAVASIEAEAVHIQPVLRCIGLDLEVNRLAAIHADVRGKPYDAGWIAACNCPFAWRTTGLAILLGDTIGWFLAMDGSLSGRPHIHKTETKDNEEKSHDCRSIPNVESRGYLGSNGLARSSSILNII